MNMVCLTRLYVVVAFLFAILSTQAYLACATNTTTLRLLVMLNLRTHQEDSAWTPRWNRGLFTYFGKLGKRWSDGVLFAGVLVIVGAYIIFLTVSQVVSGGRNGASIETLVTPEGSFPYYEVVQACTPPNIIAGVVFECEVSLFNITVIVLAFLMRKIRRQHFKDTKKVNAFLYLYFLIVYSFGPLSVVITNPEAQIYIVLVTSNSTAILCQVFLFLPKILPPLLRHLKLKYWSTTSNEGITVRTTQ